MSAITCPYSANNPSSTRNISLKLLYLAVVWRSIWVTPCCVDIKLLVVFEQDILRKWMLWFFFIIILFFLTSMSMKCNFIGVKFGVKWIMGLAYWSNWQLAVGYFLAQGDIIKGECLASGRALCFLLASSLHNSPKVKMICLFSSAYSQTSPSWWMYPSAFRVQHILAWLRFILDKSSENN